MPEEEAALTEQAAAITREYGCGVYIASVEDYWDYNSDGIYEAAKTFYGANGLGVGAEENGVLLMLSMDDRDYAIAAYGSFGNMAFTDYGKDLMAENFLDDFAYDDWYEGFSDYMSDCEEYLAQAAAGTPVDIDAADGAYSDEPLTFGENLMGSLPIGLVIGLVIALIFCLISKARMKSARVKTAAEEYVTENGMDLWVNEDRYLHTSVVRRPRPKNNEGGTTIDLDGFSGKSGKF